MKVAWVGAAAALVTLGVIVASRRGRDGEPVTSEQYASRGLKHARNGKFDEAIADLSRAIELNPRFAAAYTSRGVAYARVGKSPLAIADLTRTIKLDPRDGAAPNNRGLVYL